jgi:peptide/nickel transport system permease protein
MLNYISRRVAILIPLLFGISIVSFAVIHLAPGKPALIEEAMSQRVSLEVRQRLSRLYDLDKPLHIQYIKWAGRILHLDFGNSLMDGRPVLEMILERMPLTLSINILSLILVFLVAIPLGVKSAYLKDSFFDRAITIAVFIGFAMPVFWLALLLMQLFGIRLGILPVSGIRSLDFEYFTFWQKTLDLLWHLILPVLVSSIGALAGLCRYMRTSMLETLNQPYIYTARAKGLCRRDILYKHAFPNAILPIITILGLSIPGLLGGSVIFESIFALPGVGQLFYKAVMMRDYNLIMAQVVLGAILTMLGNLFADIGYAWADPRIRYRK